MGKIVKNYLYNVVYQLLVILTPIVTAPYLARVLGPENLGIYTYVNSSGNIITTLALLGIYMYGNRQVAYVRENRDELTKTFWEIELTRVILAVVGTLAYGVYIHFNPAHRFFLLVYYPYILAQCIDCSWVFVGLEEMKPAVVKNFITKLVNVVGIFVFVRSHEDVWIYIFMLALTTLVGDLCIYTQLPRYIGAPKADVKKIPAHLKGSVHLFLPNAATLIYLQVGKVLLEWISKDTAQLSFFDQAEKIINIPLTFITVVSTVMMPRIANEYKKGNRAEIQDLLLKAGRFTLLLAFPMMVGMFCIANRFIPWYLGNEFFPAASAMHILCPLIVFNSLGGISGSQYFTATNQIGIILRASVMAAAVNTILNLLLIPRIGYAGAAVAAVASGMVSVLVQYRYLSKQISLRSLLMPGLRYLGAALLMGLVITTATKAMAARIVTTMLQVLLGMLVYLLVLFVSRDEALLSAIKEIRRVAAGRKYNTEQ